MSFNAFVWGNNAYGTAGLGYVGNLSSPTVWRTGATYKQIAYGGTTLSYIDENDLLWTSGSWTGNGTGNYYSSPVQTSVGGTWRYISNGNPLIGIKQDGTLWAWGFNYYGNVGNGGSNIGSDVYSPVQINASTNWIYTYSSVYCSFAINSLGQMYVWGTEIYGQFGDGSSNTANYTPTLGPTNKSWTQVVSNIYGTTLALANDNTLWAWGQNAYGSCGQNTSGGLILNPVQIGSGTDWAKVLVSGYGCLALKNNGTLWAWGGVALFNSTTSYNSSPTQVSGTWLDAAATNNTVWAIKSDNTLWAAGGNGYSEQPLQPWTNTSSLIQIGSGITYKSFPTILGSAYGGLAYTDPNPTPTSSSSPSPSVTPSPTPSNSPSPTPSPTAMPNPTPTPTLIYNGNAIFGWGQSIYGLLANNTAVPGTSSPTLMFRTPNWITMPSVFNSAGALNTSRNLMVWGFNFYGELGTNNRINRSSAVQSVGTGPWAQVSMQHTGAGIKEDGTIWTWGVNDNGQLGNNTAGVSPRSSPAQVGSATDWSSVSSGEYNGQGLEVYSAVLAIKNNGTMYGWGRNALGLIGDNSIISRSSPVLSTGTDWQRVETGYVSAVALKNDGTLWSVGANSNGQLGQGDKINRSSWTQIGTGTYIDIAAGRLSAAAIRSDGTLWAFGDNAYGQLARGNALDASSPVQIGTASDWVKVSASSLTVGAINSSGQLWMWGSNGLGQIGRNATAIGNYSSPVQTVMTAYRYIDVKVGFQFVMAAVELPTLTPSPTPSPTPNPTATAIPGQLYVWGDNQNGQLGLNTSIIDKSTPVQLASLSWIKISYDSMFAGITTTGTVWGCGSNFSGNLSTNNTVNYSSLIQIGTAGSWTDIVTGSIVLHLIKNDGTLWGVGSNSTAGLIGNNAVINRSSLIQIGSATDWTRLCDSTNAGFRFAWRGNSLYAWGGNLSGMLGIGTAVNVSSPVLVDSTGTWATICAAGATTSIAIKTNGTLWTTGSNANGQLGIGSVVNKSSWTQVGSGADWIAASASYDACAAIKNDGSLYAWGANAGGLIGQGSTSIANYSSPVRVGASNDWESVVAGSACFRAQKKDGTLWVWGVNDNGVLGTNQSGIAGSYSSPVQTVYQNTWASAYGGGLTNSFGFIVGPGPTTAPTVTPSVTPSPTISPSATPSPTPSPSVTLSPTPSPSSTAATPTPTPSPTISIYSLWSWGGNNSAGILGNNSIVNKSTPVQIMSNVDFFCANSGVAMGALKNGALYTWGSNANGALGNGTVINASSPTRVGSENNWIYFNCTNTSAGIKSDNTLWMWGLGATGIIGDGTSINRSSPVQIAGSWSQVVSSYYDPYFSAGIKTNGTLWAWGNNLCGQLGQNNVISTSSPVQIGTATNWKIVAVGNAGSVPTNTAALYAVKLDGTLWAVGGNFEGQLGLGNLINFSSIVQVGSGNNWSTVSSFSNTTGAVKTDGTLWIWGTGGNGGLGLGSNVSRSSPTQVGTGTDWSSVKISRYAGSALKKDGTYWSWGFNPLGSRGNNNVVNTSSPVQTTKNDTFWVGVQGGYYSSFGLRVPELSPTPSPTLSPSPTPSVTPSPTPSPSPSPSNSPSPTPSNSPSPTPSPSPTRSPSPTPSYSPSPTPSPSPSHSPSPTPSPSPSNSPSPTPSPSNSPSPTPSPSPSPSPSATATPLPSQSPFPTFTPQPTQSPQPTFTPQPTLSPVPTVTPFPTTTQDPTPTGSPTPLPTDTPQPTLTPVPTVTPFPTLTPLPTFTPFPTLTPQATPIYPVTNNYILVPYQNNMNTTNIVPSQEGYAFNNGGGSGINLLLQFMQNDPTPQQVFIELTNNSSTNMVITIGNIVYIVEPGEYFNTVALMPFGQKVTVQSQEPGNFTPSMVYGQIFLLPTPTPTPAEILKLQKCTIAVEGDAGSVDTALLNCNSIQRTGYITITQNVTQVKVMEIPDGGIIDKTIQQIPAVIPLVCSGYLWVGEI